MDLTVRWRTCSMNDISSQHVGCSAVRDNFPHARRVEDASVLAVMTYGMDPGRFPQSK